MLATENDRRVGACLRSFSVFRNMVEPGRTVWQCVTVRRGAEGAAAMSALHVRRRSTCCSAGVLRLWILRKKKKKKKKKKTKNYN